MKIASITVYCNEEFRLNDWLRYYNEYKNDIYKHIIVNNGNEKDTERLQKKFPDSIVLFSSNKALTTAYNLAIKIALSEKQIDAIMLICNDIRLEPEGVVNLYEFLFSNYKFGMVSPVLLKKDSEIIELYGANINPKNLSFIHLYAKHSLKDSLLNEVQYSASLPGGMNLAKRSFYEKVGLQDEKLFMYSDEVDMGIRAKKNGFIMASTIKVKAWHQHVNRDNVNSRSPLAGFLMGRNEIYLAKKHFGLNIILNSIWFRIRKAFVDNFYAFWLKADFNEKLYFWYYFLGVLAGIFNVRKIPFIKQTKL